jgi:ATP-dependent RNA helicase DDX54/DBP10
MARTGSGKTAAFVIPMVERLRAHSARFGTRALILSPSRELAIQTLKVVKEFSKGTDLKCVLLVGGDSLEAQFGFMTANPDIVIATPGRFLHLKVEMSLDLSSMQYVVFDEADRLFEMGFATQLTEILHALPASRQTLLFSATLPASLVEFARAGLQDPTLIRLDAETKVSPDLQSAFFTVKGAEKEGALLEVLHDVIKMPLGTPDGVVPGSDRPSKKRKRNPDNPNAREKPTENSTIVFAATKHHVEYLANLLIYAGFAVSYVYGSLDQTARRMQVEDFRRGRTNILVVTDVAARGIDIPVLANVINYDFPPQPKIFVHRVGRTARAGQRGWSYSLVRESDTPYLLDLQLFLGKKLVVGHESKSDSFSEDVVVGSLPRSKVEEHVEWLNKVLGESDDISALRTVAGKAEKLYLKTRNSASSQSAKRARDIVASKGWTQLHQVFGDVAAGTEQARLAMLVKISSFRPQETIFEIGTRGKAAQTEASEIMKQRRKMITPHRQKKAEKDVDEDILKVDPNTDDSEEGDSDHEEGMDSDMGSDQEDEGVNVDADDVSDDDEMEVTVSNSKDKDKSLESWRDSEVFMSYVPRTINTAEERGYGVHSGAQTSSFVEAARDATMDLTNDETAKAFGVPTRAKGMRWDSKSRKYVSRVNDEDGSRGAKMIRGESGVKIAASFQSGRFDRWRKAHRVGKRPHVGELVPQSNSSHFSLPTGRHYTHKQEKAPKEADKFRDDYHVRKKRVAEAKEKRMGQYKDGAGDRKEVKGIVDIRRARKEKTRRREKTGRHFVNKKK